MPPQLDALKLVLPYLSFTSVWRSRLWSRGVKRAAEEHLWSLLGPDGPWFLVFGASDDNSTAHFDDGGHAPDDFGDSDSAHRISKVYMKAVNYDPASCVFTFGAVDLFRDSPGANSGFPSQITTRPVYTLHSDRIFWACSLERLECAAGMDGPRSVKFAASGRKITPVILDTIPLRHMSYHRPLVFTDSEADGEAGRGLRDGSSRTAVSRTTSDFWIAEDGSQWVCRKILTPDFLLGYATRSETLAPPTDARTADLSSSVLSSDVFFQYENGTDVSIHMLYARGTPSALFEGEQMVRQWAEKTCNTAEATWGLELSLAEGHFEDDCGLIDAETGMSSGRPVASNVLQLAASEDGRFTANVLNVLKLVAGDGVESGAEPLSANSDPVLCSFSVPSSHKDEDIKSEDDASSETPRVALALHLRLVRLDPLGASSARRRCEAVTLVSDDICEGVEFGTLRLEFSLQKDNDDKMHVVLSGASCTDPAQLVSSTLIVSPAGSSSRLGIFPRARIQHFYEACARLLVSVRTGEKLLWDDYMLEWLGKANSAPTSFAEINRLLEDRIDVAIVERLGLRRMALERRVKKLARELAEVAKEHPELGIDAVVVAKEYWETNAGEDLRVELKNWEPSEIAASLVEEKRRGLAKRKNDELAAQAAAQVIKFSSAPAVPRNALKERNAFAPPRTIPDGKEPARKRSRLSVDAENAPPARA